LESAPNLWKHFVKIYGFSSYYILYTPFPPNMGRWRFSISAKPNKQHDRALW